MMRNAKRRIAALVGILIVAGLVVGLWQLQRGRPQVARAELRVDSAAGAADFARAREPRPFDFPRDHGPHLEYQTEWWYYTGNLSGADGQRFGFQLTFFRRGLRSGETQRPSEWAGNHVYFAHFTVTDVTRERFVATERFSRGAAGLAGAQAEPYRVFLEDWSAEVVTPPLTRSDGTVRLHAVHDEYEIDITVEPLKPAVANGDDGLSQKSDEPGNASYYYSFTRLRATGTVTRSGEQIPVQGTAWMDHEYSTSALGPTIEGWDWFSLQLDDDWDLMYYGLRDEDGSLDPVSEGTLVAPDGTARRLRLPEVDVEVLDTWESPHSGAVYPSKWRLRVPSARLDLIVEPLLADQELTVSTVYWEGAVRVTGTHGDAPVAGRGYVELTGYAHSLQGEF